MALPRIAVTMGDPAGVGPELCLRLLADERMKSVCHPVVIGDAGVLTRVAKQLGWPEPGPVIAEPVGVCYPYPDDGPCVLDLRMVDAADVRPGVVSRECGNAAYAYILIAITEAMAGLVEPVVTAPINKESLHAAGTAE